MQFTECLVLHRDSFAKETKLEKKREIAILCLACQTERGGKQKSRMVLDRNQRECTLLFHEPSPSKEGPDYHHSYHRLHRLCHHHATSTRFSALFWEASQRTKGTFHQSDALAVSCPPSLLDTARAAQPFSLPPRHTVPSTASPYSSAKTDGSKGGAHETPGALLLLLLRGFFVLSPPSAQDNSWVQH